MGNGDLKWSGMSMAVRRTSTLVTKWRSEKMLAPCWMKQKTWLNRIVKRPWCWMPALPQSLAARLAGLQESQVPDWGKGWSKASVPLVEGDQVVEHLSKLDVRTSMDPEGMNTEQGLNEMDPEVPPASATLWHSPRTQLEITTSALSVKLFLRRLQRISDNEKGNTHHVEIHWILTSSEFCLARQNNGEGNCSFCSPCES